MNEIESALYSIPAYDRDTWVRMAMALRSEFDDGGFELWDRWSQQDSSYNKRDARAVWRSIKPYGGITINTLYAEARNNGWEGEVVAPVRVDRQAQDALRRMREQEDNVRRSKAAQKAREMIVVSEIAYHPYLESKGFPDAVGFVLDGFLLVPMRDCRSHNIVGLQTISNDGVKKFLPGMQAKLATFQIAGDASETFFCEGYATGLSIHEALKAIYRTAFVVVTFSASNLAAVAKLHNKARKAFVVADNDESGTGEKYAKETGLPYWMPPEFGDANDFHQAHGVRALADAVNNLRRN